MADDKTSVDRRGFLKYAATGAVAATVPGSMHAQDHDHDRRSADTDHQPAVLLRRHRGSDRLVDTGKLLGTASLESGEDGKTVAAGSSS